MKNLFILLKSEKKIFQRLWNKSKFHISSVTHTDITEEPNAGGKPKEPNAGGKPKEHFLVMPLHCCAGLPLPQPPLMHQLIAAGGFAFAHTFRILHVNNYFTCARLRTFRKWTGILLEFDAAWYKAKGHSQMLDQMSFQLPHDDQGHYDLSIWFVLLPTLDDSLIGLREHIWINDLA